MIKNSMWYGFKRLYDLYSVNIYKWWLKGADAFNVCLFSKQVFLCSPVCSGVLFSPVSSPRNCLASWVELGWCRFVVTKRLLIIILKF